VPPRPGQDRPHRIKSVGARGKANFRLVLILSRQPGDFRAPDIGRIADDDIVSAALHGVEIVRSHHPHAPLQIQPALIAASHLQRGGGDVDGIHFSLGKGHGARQRDRARAGADVQDPAHAARIHPGLKALHDEFGDGRARHQHPLIHIQFETGEEGSMREIGQRYAFGDAPSEQRIDPCGLARGELFGIGARTQVVVEAGDEEHQFGGLVARIVGAVTEMHARRLERPRNTVDGGAHGVGGCVG
jgi:hypothetical protein